MLQKSQWYDAMIKCVSIDIKQDFAEAKKNGATLIRFPTSTTATCNLNIIDTLKAGGFEFVGNVQMNVKTDNTEQIGQLEDELRAECYDSN